MFLKSFLYEKFLSSLRLRGIFFRIKIAVLVSGGVDSSLALALLKEQGHEVTAFYLKIWLEDEVQHLGDCAWEEDLSYIEKTCEQLSVPLQILSLQKEYWETVVAETIAEVKKGFTPNPDIWCNEKVKFGSFYHKIPDDFSLVATGHYAQVVQSLSSDLPPIPPQRGGQKNSSVTEVRGENSLFFERKEGDQFFLHQAPDPIKDQTYFLSRLSQKQLSRAFFPIGHLPKEHVRQKAIQRNLPSCQRKDSQGICFLGKFHFSDFLREHLGEKEGSIVERETGKILGKHSGFWFYTMGQRQGLGLSGGPFYVVSKIPEENTILVSREIPLESGRNEFFLENENWIPYCPEEGEYDIKLRHGPDFVRGMFFPHEHRLVLSHADRGISEGQSAVLYRDGFCLGGGIVRFTL